ncbi:hypothetical protein FQN57_001358 [Myotisia sp. PD_48]|nr:hypothetical protein FQN57_001358 [Myotisia sp. PD_48]
MSASSRNLNTKASIIPDLEYEETAYAPKLTERWLVETDTTGSQASPSGVEILMNNGSFAAAVDLGQQTVKQNKSQLGPEHRLTLSSMFELGKALHGDGRVEAALLVFQELLPLNEQALGTCHIDTIATLDAMCEEYCNMGKYELSLRYLEEERQRCEKALGPRHERTIQVLADVANLLKLLGRADDASSMFSLALERSHEGPEKLSNLTLAIQNDLRRLKEPPRHNLEQMKALLLQKGLPVPAEPFSNSRSINFRGLIEGGKFTSTSFFTSSGYEAANAKFKRLGSMIGNKKPQPPAFIPSYYDNPNKVRLNGPSRGQSDNSFQSLINRSIELLPKRLGYLDDSGDSDSSDGSDDLAQGRLDEDRLANDLLVTQRLVDKHITFLKTLASLDDLLNEKECLFWFFQRRESFMQQNKFQRWDPTSLERYVLIPREGRFANPEDCVFISHYWRTQSHPDPDGEDLQQLQGLFLEGYWPQSNYIWLDWTCLPQWERTEPQQRYFSRALQSIPRLVRDCSFMAHFPDFRPRLWVLLEVAAFTFNRSEPIGLPCIDSFRNHLSQMKESSVRHVIDKYGYRCTNNGDRDWVINWLDMLLALLRSVPSVHTRREILNAIDNSEVRNCIHQETGMEIDKERGTLRTNGIVHQFNPLPMDDHIPHPTSDIRIAGDCDFRLQEALRRAWESFDHFGISEIAEEYDLSGDYKIAETLYQLFLGRDNQIRFARGRGFYVKQDKKPPLEQPEGCAVHFYPAPVANLEKQGRYEDAIALCQKYIAGYKDPTECNTTINLLKQKQSFFDTLSRWKLQPLEVVLRIENKPLVLDPTTASWKVIVRKLKQSFFNALSRWKQLEAVFRIKNKPQKAAWKVVVRNGLRRSFLQRLDQSVWRCEDPSVLKRMEELGLISENKGEYSKARVIYWDILNQRKETLGPCHVDTRRGLCNLARISRLSGDLPTARTLYEIAAAVCDFTLGPTHPESRAVFGDLAAVILLQDELGLATEYYRQLLERTLAVVKWVDPEAFLPKFVLQALIGGRELKVEVKGEATTVKVGT